MLLLLGSFVATLLLLLAWALRDSTRPSKTGTVSSALEETGRAHVEFLPQIRQALAREDDEFLGGQGANLLQQRVRQERRRVALIYLEELREDFARLLRTAKIIASLAPEIGVGQEFERLTLTLKFA